MSTIRIIAGRYKGRAIPFNTKKFNNADITSQKVKGALFSKLGEELTGSTFLDLFAGSGQVGMEAVSRGARMVIFNEIDKKRFAFISERIAFFEEQKHSLLLNYPWKRAIPYLYKNGITADCIFIDPPYVKKPSDASMYTVILDKISDSNVLSPGGMVAVQHFSTNKLNEVIGQLVMTGRKVYGNTTLTFYALNS